MKPTWTTEKPKVAGWYWWRRCQGAEKYIFKLRMHGGRLIDHDGIPVSQMRGEWWPVAIPEPEE